MSKIPEAREGAETSIVAKSMVEEDNEIKTINDGVVPDAFMDDQEAEMSYGDSEPEHEAAARDRAGENSCYRCMYVVVTSVPFNFFIFLLIILNTFTLALYRYD